MWFWTSLHIFYQTYPNISYLQCLKSLKVWAVPFSDTSSQSRKWRSSWPLLSERKISNYNWDLERSVAGVTKARDRDTPYIELPARNTAVCHYCRRCSLYHEMLKMVRCQHLFFISRDADNGAMSALVLYITRCWQWCYVSTCSLYHEMLTMVLCQHLLFISRDAEDGAVSALALYITRCWRWCYVSTCSLYHEMLKMVRFQHLFFISRDAEDGAVSALVLYITRCWRWCCVSTFSLFYLE
jgi:hypothetical protein